MDTLSFEKKMIAKEKFGLNDGWIAFVEKFRDELHKINPDHFKHIDPKFRFFHKASQVVAIIFNSSAYNYNSLPENVKKFISHIGGSSKKGKKK